MGKPYAGELERLGETYDWANQADVSLLNSAVAATLFRPVLAVGSGGSSAAAEFLAAVHTRLTIQASTARTPLEFIHTSNLLRHQALWLLSAGGRNIDIRRALKHAVNAEPAALAILCGTMGSPLAQQVSGLDSASILEFESPAGKDGFLATNSLMGFVWLLARTYATFCGTVLPQCLADALAAGLPHSSTLSMLREQAVELLEKEHLLVVYDPHCRSIAVDIESRFSEAALGSVKICDLRNFAHGRHHWLAKYGNTSAVLGLSQPGSADLTSRTLELIPRSVPRFHLRLGEDALVSLPAGLVASLHLAGWRGGLLGIDPGRPGVPEFGRRIYNLTKATAPTPSLTLTERAVERKAGICWAVLKEQGAADRWETRFREFCTLLQSTHLKAIIFDYDGTLVSVRERSQPPSQPLAKAINDFLSRGIVIGIASGRGGSVRRDLQKAISRDFWKRMVIGYHNGAEIGTLDDDSAPPSTDPCEAIQSYALRLKNDRTLSDRLVLDVTSFQIGIQWRAPAAGISLWHFLAPVVQEATRHSLKAFSSGHSVDIVESSVSKNRVVTEICERHSISRSEVLCIGDRGMWPGNDAELLSHVPSLSVDEVSHDANTCWRFTPPLVTGPAATLWYLSRLRWSKQGLRFGKSVFAQ